jgi:glycosyltransferase involved in cell wall biosynthesis
MPGIASEIRRWVSAVMKKQKRDSDYINTHVFSKPEESERAMQSYILDSASIIMPNAQSEADAICKDFGEGLRKKMHVVPNAVDPGLRTMATDWFYKQSGLRDFVLCVGSIYSRKNQLSLVRALNRTKLDVVLVGPTPSKRYLRMCKKYCKGRLHITGPLRHPDVGAVYARAAVHVQPSWYETPGLSSLEAALLGCNVVCTSRGTARDYFGNLAHYCEPDNVSSILKAVLSAMSERHGESLHMLVATEFRWERAAERTWEAYARTQSGRLAT